MLAMELVALKPVAVEAGYAGSAKQESGLAFRTFNISKPRRSFLLVSFGHHANSTWGENPDTQHHMLGLQLNNPRIRTESLRTKVSVAGKRNFQGRDKEAETASKFQGRRCRDKVSLNNPANSGLVPEN